MSFRDLLYEISTALKANKGRSALTILGIVIGISAVVTMTSLIAGMQQSLLSEIGADQARLVSMRSSIQPLTLEDLDFVKETVDGVESVDASVYSFADISTTTKSMNAQVVGATPGYIANVQAFGKLGAGRYFVDDDSTYMRQVVIISADVNKELFGSTSADSLGKNISINGSDYQIVGILQKKQQSLGLSTGVIFLPFNTAQYRVVGSDTFQNFIALAKPGHSPEELRDEIVNVMSLRYPSAKEEIEDQGTEATGGAAEGGNPFQTESKNGFSGTTSGEAVKMVESVTGVFSAIMSSVAGISLLVGGIGIMNMMLTNVQERIREIGLRKSVGARPRDITNQFIGESIALCLIGGVVGLISGYLSAYLIAWVLGLFVPSLSFTPAMTPGIMVLAFGVSAFIGVIFGYGPARRAAKLDPVESLRHQ